MTDLMAGGASPLRVKAKDLVGRLNNYPSAILAFAASRGWLVLVLIGYLPYPGRHVGAGGVRLFTAWANSLLAGNSYPVNDPQWQYPPLADWLFVLGRVIPLGAVGGFLLLALLADLSIFLMLLVTPRTPKPSSAAWVYLVFGMLIGPVLFPRFDIFTTVCAVAALLLINKPARSAFAIAVGVSLKLWPLLLVLAHPKRHTGKVLAIAAACMVAITIPLVLVRDNAFSFLAEQGGRGVQIESVAGAYFLIAHRLGAPFVVRWQYGSAELISSGTEMAALIVTALGLLGVALIAYLRLRGRLEQVPAADVGLVLVLISISASRVFSPQFMVWVAGVGSVCLLDQRTRMRPVLAILALTCLLGQVLVPTFYDSLFTGNVAGTTVQLARIGTLLVALVWSFVNIVRTDSRLHRSAESPPAFRTGQPTRR